VGAAYGIAIIRTAFDETMPDAAFLAAKQQLPPIT